MSEKTNKINSKPELLHQHGSVNAMQISRGNFKPVEVAVIGAGYVGLPMAAVFASYGHNVVVAERDPERFALLTQGIPPISEPGLERLLSRGIASETLRFCQTAVEAVRKAEIVFLCVATPSREDGIANLEYIDAAAAEIGKYLRPGAIVVNKSTVPVGTAARVAEIIDRDDVSVVSNPEFLSEGFAVEESLKPERIVIGASSREAAEAVAVLYAPTNAPVVFTDNTTAEMIKYAANAFLATKLSYINSIAGLCEKTGADVSQLVEAVGLDSRIGTKFLSPGPGWGGSCLPKDTRALLAISNEFDHKFPILEEVIATNSEQQRLMVEKVERFVDNLEGATVAIWGLTFKAGTDDRRDSPSLEIARQLIASGAQVVAYDPEVPKDHEGAQDIAGIQLSSSKYGAVEGADALMVLTEWPEFKVLDFDILGSLMNKRVIIDGRNLLDCRVVFKNGFFYEGVGHSHLHHNPHH